MVEKTTAVDIGESRRYSRTDKEMEFILERYLAAHPDHVGPFDPDVISQWAFGGGLYKHNPVSPQVALRRRIARHCGQRYLTDPQGREVRALHALPSDEQTHKGTEKKILYYPLFETHADVIKETLQYRKGWAFNRVDQIEKDRLSYNDNNVFDETIDKMSYNFDVELEEHGQPSEYPSEPGDDENDD